jgi:hypothetical protein
MLDFMNYRYNVIIFISDCAYWVSSAETTRI